MQQLDSDLATAFHSLAIVCKTLTSSWLVWAITLAQALDFWVCYAFGNVLSIRPENGQNELKKSKTKARAKNIAVSVAAIHIREKSVAIWEQFPERGCAISHPFDIFQPLLKE